MYLLCFSPLHSSISSPLLSPLLLSFSLLSLPHPFPPSLAFLIHSYVNGFDLHGICNLRGKVITNAGSMQRAHGSESWIQVISKMIFVVVYLTAPLCIILGFPDSSVGKESTCNGETWVRPWDLHWEDPLEMA